MDARRGLNGALAGSAAAGVWALQQPLDKRAFGCRYDDVELLGKLVTRGREWRAAGLALHVQNGAIFGLLYAQVAPFIPGPVITRGLIAGMTEHVGLWPLSHVVDRYHPARGELPRLGGSRRAFAQAAWRHALFGIVLGELERRLNATRHEEPPPVPVSTNGHGNLDAAIVAA